MNETERNRLKQIIARQSKISRYPWANRGKCAPHKNSGGDNIIVGGRYEGMGESETIAIVTHDDDTEFILNAPADVEWLIDKLTKYMFLEEQ